MLTFYQDFEKSTCLARGQSDQTDRRTDRRIRFLSIHWIDAIILDSIKWLWFACLVPVWFPNKGHKSCNF